MKEQTISNLKKLKSFHNGSYGADIDKAIQALEQQPCDDAVSRDMIIYYIQGHIHEIISESGIDKNAHTNRVLRAIINGVETMPPVTPQPKSGEWRHYESTITCSECDTEFYDDIMEYCGDDVPRFCPHCGARMNGGGEDAE